MSPLNKGQRSTMRIVNVVVNYEQTKISLRVTLAKKNAQGLRLVLVKVASMLRE